jgi:hypothetical protein
MSLYLCLLTVVMIIGFQLDEITCFRLNEALSNNALLLWIAWFYHKFLAGINRDIVFKVVEFS